MHAHHFADELLHNRLERPVGGEIQGRKCKGAGLETAVEGADVVSLRRRRLGLCYLALPERVGGEGLLDAGVGEVGVGPVGEGVAFQGGVVALEEGKGLVIPCAYLCGTLLWEQGKACQGELFVTWNRKRALLSWKALIAINSHPIPLSRIASRPRYERLVRGGPCRGLCRLHLRRLHRSEV